MSLRLKVILSAAAALLLSGCATAPEKTERRPAPAAEPAEERLTLLFAGDVMAHRPNFAMSDYSKIWADIRDLAGQSDLAFANIEAPVDGGRPFSTYPNFNMRPSYPEAAAQAGFNVFSLVNNHTNDQGLEGIQATFGWAQRLQAETAGSARPLYFGGINRTAGEGISCRIIRAGAWSVLFCAVTEILNRNDFRSYLNYVPSSEQGRSEFAESVARLRGENPCDLFILSFHSDEPEYVKGVPERRRAYYYRLLDAGVDVLWANHPHVVRERELVGSAETGRRGKLILYGNGNTVSGQRWEPQLDNPSGPREDTGDGLLFRVTYTKRADGSPPEIAETEAHYITTYINTAREFVIKKLDDGFIRSLEEAGRPEWASYMRGRKKITEETKEIITWR